MNNRETKRETQRVQSNREELLERMARALPEDGARAALDGLFLARLTKPTESPLALYQPAFCFVVQGGKQVLVGKEVLWYDPGHYLLFTVDLPVIFRVEEAFEAFKAAARLRPSWSAAHSRLGLAYASANRRESEAGGKVDRAVTARELHTNRGHRLPI